MQLQLAAAAVVVSFAGGAAAAAPPLPSLTISRVAVDRVAHTVDLRARICFSAGPRALLTVHEQRTRHGVLLAANDWAPRGVEPRRIAPFACRANWRINWLLEPDLRGPGTYAASIRIRDAYGRWAPPVTFTISSP